MVSEKNKITVKSKNGRIRTEDINWYRFWYDLKSYLHPSWLSNSEDEDNKKLCLKTNNSKLLWNASYPLLCERFNLTRSYNGQISLEVFWMIFLPSLYRFSNDSIKIAGLAYYADEEPSYINQHYAKKPYYREAVQLGRSLSLARRCQLSDDSVIDDKVIEEAGLYFLYHALKVNYLDYWSRVRLTFDKKSIMMIESKSPAHLLSESTTRTFQRLWKTTHNIISVNNKALKKNN